MTKYSLRARMMIFMLAPVIIIGLLLSVFFIAHRYSDLQHQLEDAGASIIEPLAISSIYGGNKKNADTVRKIISVLHRRHSNIVRAISVYDGNNRLRITSNAHIDPDELRLAKGEPIPGALSVNRKGDMMILRTPIVREYGVSYDMPSSGEQGIIQRMGYVAIQLDMKPIELQQYREITIAGLLICCCIVCTLLFLWRLMRDVTKPIMNIASTVDRIRQGQLSSRVEGVMPGELDALKNGINTMAESLSDYHEEMQHNIDQATYDLRETLEQMEIQNVELDLAKKRAQEAARIKSEFLANMSHELRTPLNGVIGFTRLMLKTELTTTQRDHLHTIERSANNLLTLINNVLDFSKLEAKKFTLETIPFSLRWTLDEVIILLAHAAHDKELELTLNIKSDVPDNVIGDPLRLQQIITNLVGNAIKFTVAGNIDIAVKRRTITDKQAEIEVQIRDSGIGIPKMEQAQIFQAFRQADASISRCHGGTGLGLAITRRLIHEMHGDISFHSEVGRGTTFFFYIRLDLSTAMVAEPDPMECLAGKRLAFIEANPVAAQNTLELLTSTPLNITYSPYIDALPDEHFDIMLLNVPVAVSEPLTMRHRSLIKAVKLTGCILLALPCHAQVNAELLKQQGITACLQKPVTGSRLLPLLLEHCCAMACHSPAMPLAVQEKFAMTVMAVDDNPANLKLMGALLGDVVQHVVLCKSGVQAMQKAREMALDLILMDIQMPGMDGIHACQMIRKIPHQQHTLVIAVSAHIIASQTQRLLDAGMNDYMEKPIAEDKLLAILLRCQREKNAPEVYHPLTLPVIDRALALRQAAGNPDLARDMLKMLLEFLPQVRSMVNRQLAGEDCAGLAEIIHKLHGSCSYSGALRLQALCKHLEKQLADGEAAQNLHPEFFELLDEMDNINVAAQPYTMTADGQPSLL